MEITGGLPSSLNIVNVVTLTYDVYSSFESTYDCVTLTREAHGEFRMPNPKYAAYKASRPYFELVREALGDLVDGEHFFDIVTDDVVYEVLYDFPGWPRVIQGRANLMDKFRGYGDNIELQSADKLITHKADNGRVLIIEYEVHGTILATGVKYNNRFCSIVRIENRKISHWRDYMDSLAAWNALTPHAR
jgi:ketosteroid isomerase-like protein